MTELNHLSTRAQDRVKRNISDNASAALSILTASSDLGVLMNGGRRGSNFGPKAILSNIFKLASHQTKNKFTINEISLETFDQETETLNILPFIKSNQKILQIGGGHDHIYPFLKAINSLYKKITVINIDAHLDTRMDKTNHSGTPFRQFAESVDGEFHLIQFGIHDFANPDSNYTKLKNGKMDVITFSEIKNKTKNFTEAAFPLLNINHDHVIILSLDCDAIESGTMESVSAVNHHGLPLFMIEEIFSKVIAQPNAKFFGIYEYNPVYDNLSEKGARAIAQLIYPLIEG